MTSKRAFVPQACLVLKCTELPPPLPEGLPIPAGLDSREVSVNGRPDAWQKPRTEHPEAWVYIPALSASWTLGNHFPSLGLSLYLSNGDLLLIALVDKNLLLFSVLLSYQTSPVSVSVSFLPLRPSF